MTEKSSYRPKVLMLMTHLGYGGAETSFIRLANFLSTRMDVRVALFTENYGSLGYSLGHEALQPPITMLSDSVKNFFQRWWQRITTLRRLKKQHDVCISFLSGPNLLNVLAGVNNKTIISLRGPRAHDANAMGLKRRIFQHLLDPLILNFAAKIVPVSSGLCNEVHQLGGPWNLSKVTVIPPFIFAQTNFSRALEVPPEHFIGLKGQPVIVAAGRVSVEKNFQHLIRVFTRVAQNVPGAKLLLIGDGPMLPALQQQCTEAGLAMDDPTPGKTSVLFAGYQKNPLQFMTLGRVFALPSGTEGVPNILLEAMCAGTPVIAADAAWGARSILTHDNLYKKKPYPLDRVYEAEYGLLLPRIDNPRYDEEWIRALTDALQKDSLSAHYVEKARQRVLDYDWDVVAPRWLAVIHDLLKSTKP